MTTGDIRISKDLDFFAINWQHVCTALESNYNFNQKEIAAGIYRFQKYFLSPLNPYWFFRKSFNPINQKILLAICETVGADIIHLTFEKGLGSAKFSIAYSQVLTYYSDFNKKNQTDNTSHQSMIMNVEIGGLSVKISSLKKLVLVNSALFACAIFVYAISALLLLYSFAVFVLFLLDPIGVTFAATNLWHLGLALLCFLVGLSAISGKALRNIIGLFGGKVLFFKGGINGKKSKSY
jgi:hypothetical protein